ncbi:hypothetical protein EMCRGX_G005888 [Ephydatia muelleri]
MFSEDIEIELTFIQNTSVKSEMIDTSGGSLCPFCPGVAFDSLSDHAASCRHGGDVIAQHNHLRDIFADFCCHAHLPVKAEVGYGLGRDNVNSRPADACPCSGFGQRKAYVTITSSLTPVTLSEASVALGAAAFVAESRKHAANDAK